MTYLARNFIPFSLQSSTIRVPLSLESRREMRHIETFFCAKKSTKFHLNKKLNFNKSVSYVRLRVGRVNIFIKFSRYWYYLLADKYELSARLLLYTYVVYNRMRRLSRDKGTRIVEDCKEKGMKFLAKYVICVQ